MKKIYLLMAVLLATTATYAQCVIDTALVQGPGMYPDPNHLPHIVRDSLYDQTIQGKIPDTTINLTGIFTYIQTIDSVRMDSITGLPAGITWVKNPNVLPGGGYGCVEFTGSTTDTAGTYPLQAFGTVWAHIYAPLLGVNKDTFQTGRIDRPPFNGYFLVVDSAPSPLTINYTSGNVCYGQQNGFAAVTASGGSPVAPYKYHWNTGSTAFFLNNLGAGSYTITVTSGTDSATATIVISGPSSPLSATIYAKGSNGTNGLAYVTVAGGSPPYSYRWSNGQRTDTITGLAPGTYTVRVRDSTRCTFYDTVIVQDLTGIISINPDGMQLNMFPNPTNSVLNIAVESPKELSLLVEAIDMTGRVIYSAPATVSNHSNLTINTAKFNAGIYVLQLSSENQSVRQRFVVAH